ncbi:MAG: F0F1 ATP synthase subunit gamma [Candidatus Atribacteria bacterium]|nr:F0F1 ATP synthase subunit gamma [Candidatus Atribacteria bacterium]
MQFHREGYFSQLYIIFNRYLSVSEYRSTIRRVLPVPIQGIYLPTEKREELQEQYDLLSNCSSLIDRLTFEYIASQFYRGITESFISEQATRLTIMDAATTHSDEMINSLRITYQKKRQERITQELNEVTSAFQVLGKA